DNAVDRRTDDALVHIEFGVIDCRLITFKFGLPNSCGGDCSFKVILRNSASLDQAARAVGFVLKEMKVGFANVSTSDSLAQLRLRAHNAQCFQFVIRLHGFDGHDSVPSQSVDYTHAHGLSRRQPAAQCAYNNRKHERLNRDNGGYMKIKRKGWR